MQIRRAPDVRLESLGDRWVAFSAASGETHQLNDEAAAVLELLAAGPMAEADLCAALAGDTGLESGAIAAVLQQVWPALDAAGLIRTGAADEHRA